MHWPETESVIDDFSIRIFEYIRIMYTNIRIANLPFVPILSIMSLPVLQSKLSKTATAISDCLHTKDVAQAW